MQKSFQENPKAWDRQLQPGISNQLLKLRIISYFKMSRLKYYKIKMSHSALKHAKIVSDIKFQHFTW